VEAQLGTPKKIVYLHIGTHRTGTTAIQAMLRAKCSELASVGIFVPLPGGSGEHDALSAHHSAATKLARDEPNNEPLDALLDQLRRSDLTSAVLSSENFELLYNVPKTLERLAALVRLCGYNCRIILYVRDQHRYVESLYAELVKHWIYHGFDSYFQKILNNGHLTFDWWSCCFEYARLADCFANIFGLDNVNVRPYPAGQDDAWILRDFLSVITDGKATINVNEEARRYNGSISFMSVLQHLYASAAEDQSIPDPLTLVQKTLKPGEDALLDLPFEIMDTVDEIRLADRLQRDNLRLWERYQVRLLKESRRVRSPAIAPRKRLMQAATQLWGLG